MGPSDLLGSLRRKDGFLDVLNVSVLTLRSAPPKKCFWCNLIAIDVAAILASSKLTKMQLKESSDPCVGGFSVAILVIQVGETCATLCLKSSA